MVELGVLFRKLRKGNSGYRHGIGENLQENICFWYNKNQAERKLRNRAKNGKTIASTPKNTDNL
jgi:hypothetical protein